MATQVASLFGVLDLDDRGWNDGLRSAERGAQSLQGKIATVGRNLTDFGNNMTMVMAPVGLAMGYAVNNAQTFNRAMSNVNAILGITMDEATGLRDALLDIGGDSIFGPQAAVEAYYSIVSAGITDAAVSMATLEAAIATAEGGQADLAATTAALVGVMNSYQFAADDAAMVSDVFSRSVQMGVLTMDELASALPAVTGIASELGIDIGDLSAQLSFLTTRGFSASEAATALSNMMTFLLNPTTDVADAIKALGYDSGRALIEAEGLAGAYAALSEHNGGLDGLVTNVEALRGALALTGDGAEDFINTFVTGIDGATESARAIQAETAGMERLKASLEELSIVAGNTLAPTIADLLENYVIPFVQGVSEWIAANPELATTIAGVTAALVIAGPVISAVGTAITALSGAIAFVLSPAGLLIAAIGGIVYAANSLYPGGIVQLFNDATVAAQQLAVIGLSVLNDAAQSARAMIEGLIQTIQNLWDTLTNEGLDNIARFAEIIGSTQYGEIAGDLAQQGGSNIGAFFDQVGGALFAPRGNSGGGGSSAPPINIEVNQQPGESGTGLAQRIMDAIRSAG